MWVQGTFYLPLDPFYYDDSVQIYMFTVPNYKHRDPFFLSQNFLLFPEFSITSRRFYIVMALNCVNNKIVMSLINGNGRVLGLL